MSPLHFEAELSGAVAVTALGEEILSLTLDLVLEGPSPWHVEGSASFKLLLIRHRVGINETFGSPDAPSVPDVDIAAEFRRQIDNVRNWSAQLPGQGELLVVLRPKLAVEKDEILAHPAATLEFNQRAIPLKVTLQHFGAAKPVGPAKFDVTGMVAGGDLAADPIQTEFAPAQYFDLSNDDRISAPAFRPFDSGVRANAAKLARFSRIEQRIFAYEDKIIDSAAEEFRFLSAVLSFDFDMAQATGALAGGAIGRSKLMQERRTALPSVNAVKLSAGGYRLVDPATMAPAAGLAVHDNHIAAEQALQGAIAENPALAGRLMVVSELELV
jgi:hypothetical protein